MPFHWPTPIGSLRWDGSANSPTSGKLIGGDERVNKELFEHVALHNTGRSGRTSQRKTEESERRTDGGEREREVDIAVVRSRR